MKVKALQAAIAMAFTLGTITATQAAEGSFNGSGNIIGSSMLDTESGSFASNGAGNAEGYGVFAVAPPELPEASSYDQPTAPELPPLALPEVPESSPSDQPSLTAEASGALEGMFSATSDDTSASGSGSADGSGSIAITPPSGGEEKLAETGDAIETGVNDTIDTVDAAYVDAGTEVDSAVASVGEATVGLVAEVPSSLAVNYTGDISQSVAVAGLVSANVAATAAVAANLSTAATASVIASQTATMVSSVIASRPASLAGLLR